MAISSTSHLYTTSVRPSSATLLIYPPFYCPCPIGPGQRAALLHVAPLCRDVILDPAQVSIYSSIRTFSRASSCRQGTLLFTIHSLILFRFLVSTIYRYPVLSRNQCIAPILVLLSAFLSFSPSYFLVSCVY
jgi:hypothetical protein